VVFLALPAGFATECFTWYYYIHEKTGYWSVERKYTDISYYYSLNYNSEAAILELYHSNAGYSIRCLKD